MKNAKEMREIADKVNKKYDDVLEAIINKIEELALKGETHTYFDEGYSFWDEGLNYDNYEYIKEKLTENGFTFYNDGLMTIRGYVNHTKIAW